jgi:hypothetical protein
MTGNPYYSETLVKAVNSIPQTPKQRIDPTQAIMGGIGLASNFIGMANQGLGLNTNIGPMRTDSSMAPTYNAGDLWNEASSARPQGASGGEILNGAGQGAAAGAAFGPIGAGIGAVAGGVGTAITGGIRKRKQQKEQNSAMRQVQQAQQDFNTADVSFRNQRNQMEDYNQRMNSNNRLYNLYRSQY